MTFKARVVGTIKKMPGFFDFSGYKPAAYASPGILVSNEQLQYLIEEYTMKFPSAKSSYDKIMAKQPVGSSYNIPKQQVFVKVKEDSSSIEMNRLSNNMIKYGGESNVFAFDIRKFLKDLDDQMVIIIIASWVIAIILFILTFF
jgi:hypothetical protein